MIRTAAYGPRRLVKQNLKKQNQDQVAIPIVGHPAAEQPAIGTPAAGNISTVPSGNINLYSYAVPGLKTGDTYTASFTQKVTYAGGSEQDFRSSKQFSTVAAPYTLDGSLINSVYPPSGHSDYWNVLPHVLFNNARTPWLLQGTKEDTATNPTPWLALLVFTEDELTPDDLTLEAIGSATGTTPSSTPTLAYDMQVKDLYSLGSSVSQPIPPSSSSDTTQMQAIFIQGSLFAKLFGTPESSSCASVDSNVITPSIDRFKFMSHVRRFNASGVTNQDPLSVPEVAATVCPRTGDYTMTAPTIAYAHLVSLAGIADNSSLTMGSNRPAALVSLYSWTFNHLPATSYDTRQILINLASSLQPLTIPQPILAAVKTQVPIETPADSWVKYKMLAGYSIVRYRTPTGESTLAITRGFLTGRKFDALDLPPSNYGSDLALMDESSGLLDLTWQLAWELGRTTAVSDRVFASAMMRLRQAIHTQNLEEAKGTLDTSFTPIATTINRFGNTQQSMSSRLSQNTQFLGNRWQENALGPSTWKTLSFQAVNTRLQYRRQLQSGIQNFAAAETTVVGGARTEDVYDETNTPESSDYANVLMWIMDKWFLGGIPYPNLIIDPSFLPKESARSFYVDQNWFKVYIDGALSIAEHYEEGDDVREAIKKSLTTYLTTKVTDTNYPPQIPKWGLFVRSEFITRYPDMRISAPFSDPAKEGKQTEILRAETLDTDLMMLLFDREPGDFSSAGITLTPPEHQLSSMFGDSSGVDAAGALNLEFKAVSIVGAAPSQSPVTNTSIVMTDPNNAVYDLSCRSIVPQHFASLAATQTSLPVDHANAQIVGAEIVAMVPQLQLLPSTAPAVQITSATPSSLVTTRSSLFQFIPPSSTPAVVKPSALSVPSSNPPTLVTYPAPVNAMVKAVAKRNIYSLADSNVVSGFFQLSSPRSGPPSVSKPPRNTLQSGSGTPNLSTVFENIRFPDENQVGLPANTTYQTALVAFFPMSLGFKSDIHIPMVSLTSFKALLTSVVISIPVNSAAYLGLLPPFPNNTASRPTRNAGGEWPLRANYMGRKFSGVVIPNVRSTAIGRRWNTTTVYANGVLSITLLPNKASPSATVPASWDISIYQDLSLVIEDVQINTDQAVPYVQPPLGYTGPPQPFYPGPGLNSYTYSVPVQENYWNDVTSSAYSVQGQTSVTSYGVDITGSLITATVNVPGSLISPTS